MRPQQMKLLWVDDGDDDTLASSLAVEVQKTGLVIERASGFRDAAGRVARNGHDVCLIDCRARSEEGLRISKSARTAGYCAPIILLFDRASAHLRTQADQVGVWDCLDTRQLTAAELERSVRHALAHARMTQALRENEERLTLALRAAQEGVWDWNLETDAVWYSPRYKEMLGYTDREIEPHISAWKRLLHPDDQAKALDRVEAILRDEREYRLEFRLRHKAGHYLEILSQGFIVRPQPRAQATRVVGIHIDQTQRKQRERDLRHTKDYLDSILRSSPDIIISADRDYHIVTFNQAAQQATGFSADEVVGRAIEMLYAIPEEAQHVKESIRRTGAFQGEITHLTKSGSTFVVQLDASRLYDASGNVVGAMGVSRDITERKRAEAEQEQMLRIQHMHHEDLLSILDQLRQGAVMTDRQGRVTYMSKSCAQLLRRTPDSVTGIHWTELGPFQPADKVALEAMVKRPAGQRSKVCVELDGDSGDICLMEVEILDDPRDVERKICFFCDVTEVHHLPGRLNQKHSSRCLDGRSKILESIYQQIRDLAGADVTVLIEGETGTGKERVAQAIHAGGPRSNKTCIPVNCAGLTESLIGSQLFGHKRGAFTGAVADHRGVFETAGGGTVFLDEIGDLPLGMQTSLLRVLQEKEITRLGESTPRRVDARVIAATHQDLDELVRTGRFRKDLLYRIRVARITIPPLRDRRDDIPPLVEVFLQEAAQRMRRPQLSVSDEAMRRMLEYDWPGNVRELQSAIESACIVCRASVIQVGDLPPELHADLGSEGLSTAAHEDPRTRLLTAIRVARGRRTTAAHLLGVSRATFYRRLKEFRVSPDNVQ